MMRRTYIPETIKPKTVTIKPVEYDDTFLNICKECQNDKNIMRYAPKNIFTLMTHDIQSPMYKWVNVHETNQRVRVFETFRIEIQEGDKAKCIGLVNLYNMDIVLRQIQMDMWILSKYANADYGSETIDLIKNYVFNELNLKKLQIDVESSNQLMLQILETAHFKNEGVLENKIFRDGVYYDIHTMACFQKRTEFIVTYDARVGINKQGLTTEVVSFIIGISEKRKTAQNNLNETAAQLENELRLNMKKHETIDVQHYYEGEKYEHIRLTIFNKNRHLSTEIIIRIVELQVQP